MGISAEIFAGPALEPPADRLPSKDVFQSRSSACSGRAWRLTGAGLSLALLLVLLPAAASSLTSSLRPGRITEVLRQAEEHSPGRGVSRTGHSRGRRSYKGTAQHFEGRTPKLFCFSVMRTDGYEMDLMKAQLQEGAGIFACDGYIVLTQHEQVSLGLLGRSNNSVDELLTTSVADADGVTIGTSGEGFAVNAELFSFAWKTILADGRYRQHDWTVKADPDAVLLPWRLQEHLRSHTYRDIEEGGSFYVVNCNLYPENPNFPMIYGAVEVFSTKALQVYGEGESHCLGSLPWKDWQWGEDKFMGKCMELLGVTRLEDFEQVGDQRCTFSGCGDTS